MNAPYRSSDDPDAAELQDLLKRLKPRSGAGVDGHVDPVPGLAAVARRLYRQRRVWDGLLGREIVASGGLDTLLDLFVAQAERKQVSVSGACIAATVPQTTALRCVNQLERGGLVVRRPDSKDRRRHYLSLSDRGFELLREGLLKTEGLR